MLVVEIMADGGFIFEQVEEVQGESHLVTDETDEELLKDPVSLKFLMIPL